MLKKKTRYIFAFIAFVLLLLIRLRQEDLFYDPFILFFQNKDYKRLPIPDMQFSRYWIDLSLRYLINTILSFLIIFSLFRDRIFSKFYLRLSLLGFFILMPLMVLFIYQGSSNLYLLGFYTRRFLIQPMYLIILLPAFFFFDALKRR